MRFKVPQDVQRADRIIGPLTLKQMIILGAGGGIAYAIYVTLASKYFIEIWLPPVAIVSIITLAFTFLRIHDLPFVNFFLYFIEYHYITKKRFWIQGGDTSFASYLQDKKGKKVIKKEKELTELQKKQKSLEEITQLLDSHGKEDQDLTQDEKKEKLNEIINQQYK